jgi:hypothetical protein
MEFMPCIINIIETERLHMTDIQSVVTQTKIKDGYELMGYTTSLLNGLVSPVLVKGRSTLVINTLGYDEHTKGKTWQLNNGIG